MSSRRPEDMSSRYFLDILETKKWGYLYLKNVNEYVSNKSVSHNSIPDDLRQIQNHQLEPNDFNIHLTLKFKLHFYFEN